MCLVLPYKTGFLESLMVESLSQKITVAPSCLECSSSRTLLSQMAWLAHAVRTTNSASVVDKVTIGCFLEDHETTAEPNINTYPVVLFRSSISPA